MLADGAQGGFALAGGVLIILFEEHVDVADESQNGDNQRTGHADYEDPGKDRSEEMHRKNRLAFGA
jgi:hypothetical protein